MKSFLLGSILNRLSTTVGFSAVKVLPYAVAGTVLLAYAVPASSISWGLVPTSQTVSVGQPFQLELVVSGLGAGAAPSLEGFDVDITFSTIFTINPTSVAFGPFLGDANNPTETQTTASLIVPGVLFLQETSLLDVSTLDAIQGSSFSLATLTFTASSFGNFVLTGDDFAGGLFLTNGMTEQPGVDIATVNVIPAPDLVFDNPSPNALDLFGDSVSLSGERLLIGAARDDTNANDSGRAYLFDAISGNLLKTFENPSPGEDDQFGYSVSVSGNRVMIGARMDDTTGNQSGRAYLFDAVSGNVVQTFDNPSPGEDEQFGESVSVSDDRVLIGAWLDDTTGNQSGRAYLFDAVSGNRTQTFENPSPNDFDWFGDAVSVAGDRVLIGAKFDDATGGNSGRAYLFDAVSGDLEQTFDNPAFDASDEFGFSVSVSGDRVLIGAPRDDTTGTWSGRAYLFDAVTGGLVKTFENPSPDDDDRFGNSVSVAGDRVLIGAFADSTIADGSGRAYLFDAVTGSLLRTYDNPSPDPSDYFGGSLSGSAVSVTGDRALIGAYSDDTTATRSGRAYLFTITAANDDRNAPQQIDQGQFFGSLVGATSDGAANCAGGSSNDQPDIWYRYTAPAPGVLQVSTCGTNDLRGQDAGPDTVLSVQSNDGSTELACNDDWDSSVNPSSCSGLDDSEQLDSYVEVAVQAGESVVIRVGKFPGSPTADILVTTNLVVDSDGDGMPDDTDNCTLQENSDQRDSNGDGFGNVCDPDLNNDNVVDFGDLPAFQAAFFSQFGDPNWNPDADLNGDDVVDFADLPTVQMLFFGPPGPSGLAP